MAEDNVFSKEYQISQGTDGIKPDKIAKEIIIDSTGYPISKPKRIIIRTRIIHDQS